MTQGTNELNRGMGVSVSCTANRVQNKYLVISEDHEVQLHSGRNVKALIKSVKFLFINTKGQLSNMYCS